MNKGKIKWLSLKNKYGFVTDEEDKDYYFYLTEEIIKSKIDIKDIVEFETFNHKKGIRAKNLKILEKHSVEKVKCPNCSELMVPRLVIEEKNDLMGTIKKLSICPYCEHQTMVLEESEIENSKIFSQLLFLFFMIMITIVFVYEFILN